jgi:hypothetical protein
MRVVAVIGSLLLASCELGSPPWRLSSYSGSSRNGLAVSSEEVAGRTVYVGIGRVSTSGGMLSFRLRITSSSLSMLNDTIGSMERDVFL